MKALEDGAEFDLVNAIKSKCLRAHPILEDIVISCLQKALRGGGDV